MTPDPGGFGHAVLPGRSRWHPALTAGVALVVGVVVSFFVYQTLRGAERRHLSVEFHQLAAERIGSVRRSFEDVVDAVLALRAFHGVSEGMGRDEFAIYAAPLLSERPGIRALEWVPRVARHRRQFLEREAHYDGLADFTFTERDSTGTLRPSPERRWYYPVVYAEPYRGNETALGFDLASDPVRREALDRGRDTGRPAASPPIRLLTDASTVGCLIVAPVYNRPLAVASVEERRAELRGFVVGVVTSGAMLETALGNFSPEGVSLSVADVTSPGTEVALGAWKPGVGSVAAGPGTGRPRRDFVREARFDLAGRTWKVTAVAGPSFFRDSGSPIAEIVLIGLLAMTSLVALYLYRTAERAEKLRESESRYRTLVEHAPEAIVILDADTGRFVDANEKALRMLEIPEGELGRYGPAELSPELQPGGGSSRKLAADLVGRAAEGEIPVFEWMHRSVGGREIPAEIRLVRLPAGKRNLIRGSMTDITERRRGERERAALERRLAEARKLESLGLLTGGIAHDFNNLLTPILGRTDLALSEMPAGSPGRSHLEDIRTSAERAGELIGQLLALTGQARVVLTTVHLNEVVQEMCRLWAVSIPGVELRMDLDPACPRVRGDIGQMRQLVLNLITNAGDAMEGRPGTIRIATGLVEAGSELLADADPPSSPAPGPYARLTVSDTGVGIPPEILESIFDPFFSTKKQGRGLGLATLRGIVKSHGGTVTVRSEPGRGTTFDVLLPAAPAEADASPTEGSGALLAPQDGKATILVADDERRVRSLVTAVLERDGYRTCEVESGAEALVALQDGAGEVRLALLDLNMPGLSGVEMLTRLRRSHPDLPVVVMSGFGEKEALAACSDLGLAGFLPKPFDPGQLLRAVHEALEPV